MVRIAGKTGVFDVRVIDAGQLLTALAAAIPLRDTVCSRVPASFGAH
jgi:hypothetical protein